MHDLERLAHRAIRVGDDFQVRKPLLRLLSVLAMIRRYRDDLDAGLAVREFLEMAFELTELGQADPSPMAAIKHQRGQGALAQVSIGERLPVGKRGRKRRDLFANLKRSLVLR